MKLSKEVKTALKKDKILRAKILNEFNLKTDINIDRWVKSDYHRLLSLPVLKLISNHLGKSVEEIVN
jgi:hypothetical protein